MKEISNEDLKSEMIPVDAKDKVVSFAHSFNGYEYGGTMPECGKIAKKVKQAMVEQKTAGLTLSEIRASLFYYYRALRHSGMEQEDQVVEHYLALIRERVE
jgi:hypothetical protein